MISALEDIQLARAATQCATLAPEPHSKRKERPRTQVCVGCGLVPPRKKSRYCVRCENARRRDRERGR